MARTAKKTAARRPSSASARRAAPARGQRPAPAKAAPAAAGVAPDLAGGLRSLLGAVEGEVRAVSTLSEKIDDLVAKLNAAREEQAQRLTALDTLKGAAEDGGLSTFLDKLIKPRPTRVTEVVPARLKR
jgi:hypothetical protein